MADIDQASPSEDEEVAQQALRGEGGAGVGSDGSRDVLDDHRDVLDDHRARNRPNKPPNQQQLLKAAKRQLEDARTVDADDDDDDDDDEGQKNAPTVIGRMNPTQRRQDTTLDAGEKQFIEPKNSFDVSLHFTISFQLVTITFKTLQGFLQR